MIILNNVDRSLTMILGAAVTTNELPFVVSYVDLTLTTYNPLAGHGTSLGTSSSTLVAAPGVSTQRQIKNITIYNSDTVNATVTVRYTDNFSGVNRIIRKVTLAPDSTLEYNDGTGWKIIDKDGNILTSSGGTTPSTGATVDTSSATGTQNNFNVTGKNIYLMCSGAAPVFTGFTVSGAAPTDGDRIRVVNIGTGTARVADEDSGSTAANRITGISVRGQIVGVGGAIELVYYASTSRWRIVDVLPGSPIAVTYNSGDFTGSGSMTWTVDSGDVTTFTYQQSGKIVTFSLAIENTSTGGTLSTTLKVALPNSFVIAREAYRACVRKDAATWGSGMLTAQLALNTVIGAWRSDLANWASATNNTSFFGSIDIEVN